MARADRVTCEIEIKNVRKCLVLDIVPVLLARRIPYVTFRLLSPLGVFFHQQYNHSSPPAKSPWPRKCATRRFSAITMLETAMN
ncbi:MAG: hypothetical protein AB7O04_13270 [Hyphomonadaceae bacterium]